ncbi:MAG: hypothetical protein U1G07_20885 [Verrucomicrobiota bacterium]
MAPATGADFTFPQGLGSPAGYLVVAKNRAASSAYGNDIPSSQEFEGRLDDTRNIEPSISLTRLAGRARWTEA